MARGCVAAMTALAGCTCDSVSELPDGGITNAYDCHCRCTAGILPPQTQDVTVCLSTPTTLTLDAGLTEFLQADCDTRICKNAAEALGYLKLGKPGGSCISCAGTVPVVHAFNLPACNSCTPITCTTTMTDAGNLCPVILLVNGQDAGMQAAPDGSGKCCSVVGTDSTGCVAGAGRSVPTTPVCTANTADPAGVVPQTGLLAVAISHRAAGALVGHSSTLTLVPNNDATKAVTSKVSGRVEFVNWQEASALGVSVSLLMEAAAPLDIDVDVPFSVLGSVVQVPVKLSLSEASLAASSEEGALALDASGSGRISPVDFAGFLRGHVKVSSSNPLVPRDDSNRTVPQARSATAMRQASRSSTSARINLKSAPGAAPRRRTGASTRRTSASGRSEADVLGQVESTPSPLKRPTPPATPRGRRSQSGLLMINGRGTVPLSGQLTSWRTMRRRAASRRDRHPGHRSSKVESVKSRQTQAAVQRQPAAPFLCCSSRVRFEVAGGEQGERDEPVTRSRGLDRLPWAHQLRRAGSDDAARPGVSQGPLALRRSCSIVLLMPELIAPTRMQGDRLRAARVALAGPPRLRDRRLPVLVAHAGDVFVRGDGALLVLR